MSWFAGFPSISGCVPDKCLKSHLLFGFSGESYRIYFSRVHRATHSTFTFSLRSDQMLTAMKSKRTKY